MRHSFLVLGLVFINLFPLMGQYKKTAACRQEAFDKKVNSYLSYTVPVISVQDAHDKFSDYLFLDAREFNEYQTSHIPQARYVGYDDFDFDNIKDIPVNKKIIVYCSVGYRSEKIATQLRKKGYKQVWNLYGSLFEWVNAGYDVSDKTGKPTTKIHTYNKDWSQWVTNPKANKIW
ncbi:MAG TPA: rhodanese-like domain-containing protein [Saprospiraceae bacterium]|nr:rhodanese-like domain-containing protein [Saprospiraceae bacterium]